MPYEPNTGSDCEVLIPLYVKFGLEKACSLLRVLTRVEIKFTTVTARSSSRRPNVHTGMFSFIIYDQRTGFLWSGARYWYHIIILGQRFGRVGLDRVRDEVAGQRLPRRRAVQARPLLEKRHAAVRPVVRPDVAVGRLAVDALRLYEAEEAFVKAQSSDA